MKYKNKIFVIFGVSGSGQDSVINGLKERGLDFEWVITTTSRKMRPGELEGKPYYFVDKKNFKQMVSENQFVEWDHHYGINYGCTYVEYERVLASEKIIIWKTDMRGALTIKSKFPETTTIYIKPPSLEATIERLKKRRQDSPEVINQRIHDIKEYLKPENDTEFDFNIVNKDGKLEETIDQVLEIINSYIDQ